MCGIFGYVGTKPAASIIRQGLKNLDYRGYDSWGIAVTDGSTLRVVKAVGEVPTKLAIKPPPVGHFGLGHTRWATNGGVTQANAHPHIAQSGEFVLVQNGIVENAEELKEVLQKHGWQFISETDTEVIVHLLEAEVKKQRNLAMAIKVIHTQLQGRNTFAVLTKTGELLALKKGSPLVLGKNHDRSEYFLSSDTASLVGLASDYLVLEDGQQVAINKDEADQIQVIVNQVETDRPVQLWWEKMKIADQSSKLVERHYMIQEIKETPLVLRTLARQPRKNYLAVSKLIKTAGQVYVIGSGSTGLAAAVIASNLRQWGGVAAIALVGAEANSYLPFMNRQTVIIAPSQSGETADVLEVLVEAKKRGVKLITFVNMPGSTMSRIADINCMTEAGPERCVMSTKVFSAQLVWGYLIAQALVGKLSQAQQLVIKGAQQLTIALADTAWNQQILHLAKRLMTSHDIFLLGTGSLLPVAQEGMVKIIEGTYKHAHALPAGDLKHYAITLMEPSVPVVLLDSGDFEQRQAVENAAREVSARGARTIGIGPSPSEVFAEYLATPDLGELQSVASAVVLQLLSYHLTVMLGLPVDKPRNIAKSVTVK